MSSNNSENLKSTTIQTLGNLIVESAISLGDLVVVIHKDSLRAAFEILKLDTQLQFDMLSDITAVDWLDSRNERFEVVYHLLSTTHFHRIRVKAWVPENNCEVDSVSSLWASANFMEREVWDMYGIRFKGHPDLRRILMYDEFIGHPLRKDYPVQGKQPRVPLISPEVENTARDMFRGPLVHINKRKDSRL